MAKSMLAAGRAGLHQPFFGLTPVAMALVNRKVGDEVEFELNGSKRRHRIEKIEAWKTEAPATTTA
jgi:hypothetical protein